MRISDWSSDVCSSDLFVILGYALFHGYLGRFEERSPFVLLCAKDIDANDPARKCTAAIPGSYTHIFQRKGNSGRSEEHTSELQSLMRISYAVFCLKKKKTNKQ